MTNEELKELKGKRPFQPFRITTTQDETFDILHPGLMLIARNGISVGTPHPSEPLPMAKDIFWLDAEDIVSAELIEAKA